RNLGSARACELRGDPQDGRLAVIVSGQLRPIEVVVLFVIDVLGPGFGVRLRLVRPLADVLELALRVDLPDEREPRGARRGTIRLRLEAACTNSALASVREPRPPGGLRPVA